MTDTYRVEVGITRTGVAYVEAEEEAHARQKAKADAKDGRVNLKTAESFTNNVRTVHSDSTTESDGGSQ